MLTFNGENSEGAKIITSCFTIRKEVKPISKTWLSIILWFFLILNFLNDCYSDQALWLQVNDYNHKETFIWFVKHYNEKGENLTSCNCSFVLILAVHNGEVNWDKWQAPSINNLNKKFEQKCKEKFVCFANKTRKTFFQICEILPIFQH